MADCAENFNPRPTFYALAAALWLAGFLCALMPLQAFEAESFFVAVLCLFASSFFVLAVFPVRALAGLMQKPVMWMALAFWLLAALSVLFSEVPFVALIYFCFFSALPLSFFITVFSGESPRFLNIVLVVVVLIMAALAVSCLVQFFFFPEMLFWEASVAWPLANPNSLAGVLVFGFVGVLGWMVSTDSRLYSNLALVLAALLVAALFTTGSRGAILSLLPALGLFFMYGGGLLKKHRRCLGLLAVLSVIAFCALSYAAPVPDASPLRDYVRTIEGEQSFLYNRPALWASALDIIKEYPLSGTGVGTFFLYYPEVRNVGDPSSAGLMVHSDPLQFAAEMGILAPVLFYAFLIVCVMRTIAAFKKLAADDVRRVKILIPFCALGAVVVHAHITFHFHVLSMLMLIGLCLGFWYLQTAQALGEKMEADKEPHQNPSLRFGLAVPLVLILAVFAPFQASEILVNRSKQSLAQGDIQTSIAQVNRAGHLSGNMNARALITAANFPLGILQLNAPLMADDELVGMTKQVEALLDDAWAANPRLAQILYHRAELLSYTQPFLPSEAKSEQDGLVPYYLRQALALDPLNLSARVKLANLSLRKGERQAAMDILKEGLVWTYKAQSPRHFLEKTINLANDLGDEETGAHAKAEWARYMPQDQENGP